MTVFFRELWYSSAAICTSPSLTAAPSSWKSCKPCFGTATFYYVARFVESPELRQTLPQSGGYFAFSLVGFVFLDYLNAALDTFDRSLEEARDSGTLEHLLVTQTSLPGNSRRFRPLSFRRHKPLRIAVYIAWGALFFWLSPTTPLIGPPVVLVLLVSLLAFSGLGILSASYLLLFKRGNPAQMASPRSLQHRRRNAFPVSILPDWLHSSRASIPSPTRSTPCAPRFSAPSIPRRASSSRHTAALRGHSIANQHC